MRLLTIEKELKAFLKAREIGPNSFRSPKDRHYIFLHQAALYYNEDFVRRVLHRKVEIVIFILFKIEIRNISKVLKSISFPLILFAYIYIVQKGQWNRMITNE